MAVWSAASRARSFTPASILNVARRPAQGSRASSRLGEVRIHPARRVADQPHAQHEAALGRGEAPLAHRLDVALDARRPGRRQRGDLGERQEPFRGSAGVWARAAGSPASGARLLGAAAAAVAALVVAAAVASGAARGAGTGGRGLGRAGTGGRGAGGRAPAHHAAPAGAYAGAARRARRRPDAAPQNAAGRGRRVGHAAAAARAASRLRLDVARGSRARGSCPAAAARRRAAPARPLHIFSAPSLEPVDPALAYRADVPYTVREQRVRGRQISRHVAPAPRRPPRLRPAGPRRLPACRRAVALSLQRPAVAAFLRSCARNWTKSCSSVVQPARAAASIRQPWSTRMPPA